METPVRTERAMRSRSDRMLAGVAGGLAEHLGWDARWIRAGFVGLLLLNGMGAVLYGALWLLLPQAEPATGDEPNRWWRDSSVLLPAVAVMAGVIALLGFNGIDVLSGANLGAAIAALGGLALWMRADLPERTERSDLLLSLVGSALMIIGLLVVIGDLGGWQRALQLGALGLMVVAAIGFGFLPLFMRRQRGQAAEREAKIREEERAVVAAHLHDSVLQTFALIRRSSDSPDEVGRLARTGESELRDWLYPSPSLTTGIVAALKAQIAMIQTNYPTGIELVSVGDLEMTDRMRDLVAAAAEAMVNAAKHSNSPEPVRVFVECGPDQVDLYVRDRGRGFATEHVPLDRHGIRDSIVARMQRCGGTAEVSSTVGEGTEVHLQLPTASVSS